MTGFLFQMGISNAVFALALAIIAMVVGARARRPHLAHMLWLLVFVKLVTPPIVTIPVCMPTLTASNDGLPAKMNLSAVSNFDVEAQPATALAAQAPSLVANVGAKLNAARPLVAFIWLLGSLFIFVWSVRRVVQFTRLLRENTEPAPHELQTAAATIAKQLKLNALPAILTTSAHVSPMVWWAGGKVRVVIPASLLNKMDVSEWRWILAHELTHVRRRDYLVRWLEWLACVCFRWNPVVWWAQRNLRAMEEICCDALVLSCLKLNPRSYADSLLTAVEFLACPAIRPPAMASEINSGGFLERRFRMIVSETPNRVNSRWLRACVLLCAAAVLPLGMAYAQDYEAVAKRLKAAVEARELTGEQARAMLGALKKADDPTKEAAECKGDTKLEATWKKLQAMVKAGELTEEQAVAKMSAIKKDAAKTERGPDAAKAYLEKVKKELGAAVEAGKISKEDAAKKYEAAEKAIKERTAAGRGQTRAKKDQAPDRAKAYLMKVKEELGAAIKAGKISEEDAAKRFAAAAKAIKERMAAGRSQGGSKRITPENLSRAGIEIRKAVAEGKLSKEDGRKKMGDAQDDGRTERGGRQERHRLGRHQEAD
jgi:beta-lactamase regulating signal transducer with metallopeptidase domain